MNKIFPKLLSSLFIIGVILMPLVNANAEDRTWSSYYFPLSSSGMSMVFNVPEGFSIADKVGDERMLEYSYTLFKDGNKREIEIQISEYPDKDKRATGVMCYELDSDLYSSVQLPIITKDINGAAGISYWVNNDFYKHKYYSDGSDCIKITFVNDIDDEPLSVLKWFDIWDEYRRSLGDFIDLAKKADDYYKVKSAEILLYEKALKMDETLPILTEDQRYDAISELANFYYDTPYESFYFYDITPTFEHSQKLEEMKDFYMSQIRKYPNDALLCFDLSNIYARLKNKKMAFLNLRKALQIDPLVISRSETVSETVERYSDDHDLENILKLASYMADSEVDNKE